jgi:hypothetical protein
MRDPAVLLHVAHVRQTSRPPTLSGGACSNVRELIEGKA